jgi:hypothetical protein
MRSISPGSNSPREEGKREAVGNSLLKGVISEETKSLNLDKFNTRKEERKKRQEN